MLNVILFVLAGVLAGLSAFGVGGPRVHLGWLAVALIAFGLAL